MSLDQKKYFPINILQIPLLLPRKSLLHLLVSQELPQIQQTSWFAEFGGVPDLPIDEEVISEEEVRVFAKYLSENTFFGPNSWYVNSEENQKFRDSVRDQTLEMPSLFVHATYDYVCDTTSSTKFAAQQT